MKEKLNEVKPYLINILLAVIIFLTALIICDVSPFGNMIIGKSDAITQYKPMLYNYIMNIKNGTLELYSFTNGLGNPMIFNLSYYLMSPINYIGLLFNNGDIMYLAVIVIKIAIAAGTTTFYAKKRGCSNIASTIASLSYVFSSWFLAYYYNIMWLDLFMMFPLFQYFLEKLIKDKKIIGFIFTFAYIYVTNFYQAFAVLIYAIVYFIVRNFFYEKISIKEKFIGLLRFLFAAVLTISLIFVYLYILVQVKRQTGLGTSDITNTGYIINSLDFLKSMFYGTTNITTEFTGHTYPNIALNTLILINIIYMFFNKKINDRDKMFALIGITLMTCCIFIKTFDYIMNMFHNVVDLTYSYSFIFCFLGTILFIKNATNFEEKQEKKCIPIILILLALLTLNIKNMDLNIYIFNLIFLLSYLVLVIFYNKSKVYKYLIVILVCIQSLVACVNDLPYDTKKETISYDYFETKPSKFRVNSIGKNDFLNKNMYTNQDTTYLFSSMLYNTSAAIVQQLGCYSGNNSISCLQNNKLFNMMFNVKNDYYLEKIYTVNSDIKTAIINEYNPQIATEELVNATTGIKDIHKKIVLKAIEKDNKNYFKTEHSFYFIEDSFDGYTTTYPQVDKEFYTDNLDLKETTIYVYKEDKLKEIYDTLKKNQIEYTLYTDSHIEGNINVEENQIIFTTIPYDETWQIKIDGKEVDPIMVLDSLIAIETTPGKHKLTMQYKPNYTIPTIISSVTFIGLITTLILQNKKQKKSEN